MRNEQWAVNWAQDLWIKTRGRCKPSDWVMGVGWDINEQNRFNNLVADVGLKVELKREEALAGVKG